MVERGITPEIAADVAHDQLGRGFRRASSRSGDATRTSFYLFAGRAVRLRIVGGPLVQRLARPFAHLAAQRPRCRQSHLTIDLWDETSTGVGLRERPRGSASSGRAAIGVAGGGRWVSRRTAGFWTALDRVGSSLVGWIEDAGRLGPFEMFTPLQSELGLWYRDHGIQPIHAGLILYEGKGALLAGPGGAGKSTVLLSCLESGFQWVADDRLGLEEVSPVAFTAHSLYSSVAVLPDHLLRFDRLQLDSGSEPHRITPCGKTFALLFGLWPDAAATSAPIRVILLPQPAHSADTHSVRRASPREALLQLLSTTLRLVPRTAKKDAVERLGRLVRAVPSRWLDIGSDFGGLPACVRSILDGVSDGAG